MRKHWSKLLYRPRSMNVYQGCKQVHNLVFVFISESIPWSDLLKSRNRWHGRICTVHSVTRADFYRAKELWWFVRVVGVSTRASWWICSPRHRIPMLAINRETFHRRCIDARLLEASRPATTFPPQKASAKLMLQEYHWRPHVLARIDFGLWTWASALSNPYASPSSPRRVQAT